jgi:hypothetical protein
MTTATEKAKYRHDGIKIAGNTYDVLTDADDTVIATACKGRWPMTSAATGDQWLDTQLQQAVYDRKGR